MSLFNCWFYWRPQEKIIVAPKLVYGLKNVFFKNSNDERGCFKNNFGDEFSNLKNYRKGENKSHIDWKSYAKTNKFLSKEFITFSSKA